MKRSIPYLLAVSILFNLCLAFGAYQYYKGYKEYKVLAGYKTEKYDDLAANFKTIRDKNIELSDELEKVTDKSEEIKKKNSYLSNQNKKLQGKVNSLAAVNQRYRLRVAGRKNKNNVRKKYTKKKQNCGKKYYKSNRTGRKTKVTRNNRTTTRNTNSKYTPPRNYNRQ